MGGVVSLQTLFWDITTTDKTRPTSSSIFFRAGWVVGISSWRAATFSAIATALWIDSLYPLSAVLLYLISIVMNASYDALRSYSVICYGVPLNKSIFDWTFLQFRRDWHANLINLDQIGVNMEFIFQHFQSFFPRLYNRHLELYEELPAAQFSQVF